MMLADIAATLIREFPIGYFALSMSTGIISLAAFLTGYKLLGQMLLIANIIFYSVLWLLVIVRTFQYLPEMITDMTDYQRGPAFLTMVAGTSVLGAQFMILRGNGVAGLSLLFLAVLLWMFLLYAWFFAMIIRTDKPEAGKALSGTWLLIVVATQSIAVLATLVADSFSTHKEIFLCFSLVFFLLGGFLYCMIIMPLMYRLLLLPLSPAQFTPPYWIIMGAAAITTLSGAELIFHGTQWRLLAALLPVLKVFTLLSWIIATWWIPLLGNLELWHLRHRRFSVRYDAEYWDMVFPFGMYCAASFELSQALSLSFLEHLSRAVFYAALLLWLLVFAGFVRRLCRHFSFCVLNRNNFAGGRITNRVL